MPIAKLSTGINLNYESYGRGEALVFIPGTGFAGNVWIESQEEELARSHQVIVHDPRGCGRSTHAKGVYTIDVMGNDVVALLEHLGLPHAHMIGHSMGGRIGLSIALNFPGYVKHEICDSDTYFTPSFRKENPDKVKVFYQMVWSHHAKLEEYLRLVIARSNWEATHRLGDIAVPTLVVVGDSDVVGANHVKQAAVLADRIPTAESKVLKGQSHGFFWQTPEETNAWIADWIQRH